jgi:TonB family protein
MPSTILHNPDNKESRFMGVAATVLLHALAFVLCFKMIFINDTAVLPLSQMEILIEPEPERVEIKPERFEIKPLVTGKKIAETPPEPTKKTEIDDQSGDVEVPIEKPIPVEIDKRSLYRSEDTGETAGNASGARPDSKALFAGDNDPNAGASDEASSAKVRGRSILGRMEQPTNTSNREGRVVVEITVDQSGKVTKAQARVIGSTIQDAVLWKAAEEAARKTVFNADPNSSPMQTGTITYVFKLK